MAQVTTATPLVLVTGATGFVGSALCAALPHASFRVKRALRARSDAAGEDVVVGEIGSGTDWSAALAGVEAIVHLAARTHVLHETAADSFDEYRRINVEGTRQLAEQAAEAGVQRFVFLSSIKANGEATGETPFRETDLPRPEDAYGITKHQAELALAEITGAGGMELVVLRPPLVYGPGVKGNFLRLMRLVAKGVPLPFGSVRNRRSVIYLGNLVDAIIAGLQSPRAAGRTYLVSDRESLSTPELLRRLARALGVPPRIFPCPVAFLRTAGALTGKSAEVARLTRSLEIDADLIAHELGWRAPHSVSHGLAETARWYNARFAARAPAQ